MATRPKRERSSAAALSRPAGLPDTTWTSSRSHARLRHHPWRCHLCRRCRRHRRWHPIPPPPWARLSARQQSRIRTSSTPSAVASTILARATSPLRQLRALTPRIYLGRRSRPPRMQRQCRDRGLAVSSVDCEGPDERRETYCNKYVGRSSEVALTGRPTDSDTQNARISHKLDARGREQGVGLYATCLYARAVLCFGESRRAVSVSQKRCRSANSPGNQCSRPFGRRRLSPARCTSRC